MSAIRTDNVRGHGGSAIGAILQLHWLHSVMTVTLTRTRFRLTPLGNRHGAAPLPECDSKRKISAAHTCRALIQKDPASYGRAESCVKEIRPVSCTRGREAPIGHVWTNGRTCVNIQRDFNRLTDRVSPHDKAVNWNCQREKQIAGRPNGRSSQVKEFLDDAD